MISVSLVPTPHIYSVWDDVKQMIEDALTFGGGVYSIQDVFNDLLTDQQSLWIAIEDGKIIGCTTISINQYPRSRSLVYKWLGGKDVARWLPEGHRVCSAYAREFDCSKLECLGRSGWKPFLEKLGWRQTGVQYEFELKD